MRNQAVFNKQGQFLDEMRNITLQIIRNDLSTFL